MKKFLLVIYHYMEEETYFYDSIDELLEHFNCKSLSDLFEDYDCNLYIVSDIINKYNFKTKEVIY